MLVILLDYGHPIGSKTVNTYYGAAGLPTVAATDEGAPGFNVFRLLLSKIDSLSEFNFLYRGFVRLLSNVHQSDGGYLPYSVTKIAVEQELLVLFWKCLEENKKFMQYVLR